jgi:hypothetical protein
VITVAELARLLDGRVPATIATCSADGIPNVSLLSHVEVVGERSVALSHQFFNKTRANLLATGRATVMVIDPRDGRLFRLAVRYHHEETQGPLFERMALRIQAIASQSGLERVFRLRAADVCEVLELSEILGGRVPEALAQPRAPAPGPEIFASLGGLRTFSVVINQSRDLESLFTNVLEVMAGVFGFEHTLLFVPDESGERLFAVASRGYASSGAGAEVRVGEGIIGTVARARRLLKLSVDRELRYARAMSSYAGAEAGREVPLPGLRDVDTQVAIPLVVADKLVGVLSVESTRPLAIDESQEAFLAIVADHVALAIERMTAHEEEDADEKPEPVPPPAPPPAVCRRRRQFLYYPADDCVFVDGSYLVRNVPGKILWKLLTARVREGRTEFTNRELRLDATLGLPAVKDNLESRLILLRRRLEERCPDVRLVPVARGRFALQGDADLQRAGK